MLTPPATALPAVTHARALANDVVYCLVLGGLLTAARAVLPDPD